MPVADASDPLTVLSVAYPLAPVGPDAVGGAEQVLTALDAALVHAGHKSLVIACSGSATAGELIAIEPAEAPLTEERQALAQERCRAAISEVLRRRPLDIVHLHGVDFATYVPGGAKTLVTIHLPFDFYPAEIFQGGGGPIWFNPVSEAQRRTAPAGARLLPAIENGVDVEAFSQRRAKRDFALVLARICPEKGVHLALDAAAAAGTPLLIGGEVFPYLSHRRYFEAQIAPRLDRSRRYLGPLGFLRKRRLLAAARCILIPSLVAETSSLVALEALASGTPIIAFRAGALTDIVENGKTGFLVSGPEQMAKAISLTPAIDPEACRAAARDRFPLAAMTRRYLTLYHELARDGRAPP